jgi:N-formylglutamate amidohydrolase
MPHVPFDLRPPHAPHHDPMTVSDAPPNPAQAIADAAAFEVSRPAAGALGPPIIFASPHSGRVYPPELLDASRLGPDVIRRSEDAFVDKLIAGGVRQGATVLVARYARAYMDLNREAWELDPAMFEDELPAFARRRTARVAAGLGSIARVVADGQEIYDRKLTFAEAEGRIAAVYRPYHAALQALLDEARQAHGVCVLLDWHSMPPQAGESGRGQRSFDMILGDRFGASCAPGVTDHVERELQAMGYHVARNTPYAGGHVTEFYGKPAEGRHALQIEINRGLYLKTGTLEPGEGFSKLASDLETLARTLTQAWPALL